MKNKILVCYKSVTGFTKGYAEMIAREIECAIRDVKDVTPEILSQYDIVVFGSRFHAGTVDGLKRIKDYVEKSKVKNFIIFATGAMPNAAEGTIRQAWENNLNSDELIHIPHFYMQGGLCYEKMPLSEKILMKTFAAVMKKKLRKKKDKTEEERQFERVISTSYDISSKEYVKPLISLLKEKYM